MYVKNGRKRNDEKKSLSL